MNETSPLSLGNGIEGAVMNETRWKDDARRMVRTVRLLADASPMRTIRHYYSAGGAPVSVCVLVVRFMFIGDD